MMMMGGLLCSGPCIIPLTLEARMPLLCDPLRERGHEMQEEERRGCLFRRTSIQNIECTACIPLQQKGGRRYTN